MAQPTKGSRHENSFFRDFYSPTLRQLTICHRSMKAAGLVLIAFLVFIHYPRLPLTEEELELASGHPRPTYKR